MTYDFKTKDGGIFSASCRRPNRSSLRPINDMEAYKTRIAKCIAHAIRKESDEVLIWYFQNSTFLAPEQAMELHDFLCGQDNVETTYVAMDRLSIVIKTCHGVKLTLVLVCKFSRFYVERPPKNAGMSAVITELETLPSFRKEAPHNTVADTPSVVDLLSPSSIANSEFTLETMD
ncbi:hypothetical protein SEMRO_126_G060510.1 [Seminavis robusta]|uniref:Uncharacterized protein n=1 Tax=Seminavis robusta TaxID=568900 RepID=A0A9N8H4X6_9STRA|nr:hypothetical protein SEMRO_126_G060510.1 [Seminavis robusta]|eukprot:Sro126_g060510.1 n/a (175) ;mRNA; r:26614-27138